MASPELIQQMSTLAMMSLEHFVPENSVFYGELLVQLVNSEESKNLLAKGYMAQNKNYKAFYLLKDCTLPENRYLFAVACIRLSKFAEAEQALLQWNGLENNGQYSQIGKYAGFYQYLLGLVYERQQRFQNASDLYQQALKENPYLWCAWERLVKLAHDISPKQVFQQKEIIPTCLPEIQQIDQRTQRFGHLQQETIQQYENAKPLIPSSRILDHGLRLAENRQITDLDATFKIHRKQNSIPLTSNSPPNFQHRASEPLVQDQIGSVSEFKVEKCTKLQISGQWNHTESSEIGNSSLFLSNQEPFTASGRHIPDIIKGTDAQTQKTMNFPFQNDGLLLKLLCVMGYALKKLTCFYPTECLELLDSQLRFLQEHPWVLQLRARCHMELTNYEQAAQIFQYSHEKYPYFVENLAPYSTCLWHLKRTDELAYLAQFGMELAPFASETWIAVGNCFSASKDAETAIIYFNRASKLDPYSPLPLSLCGHEYTTIQNYLAAKRSYQNALNLDITHYNAWWGLGNLYYCQEKYNRACELFSQAVKVNSRNALLYFFLGLTLFAQKRFRESLLCHDRAMSLQPNNDMNRYHRAKTLQALENYEEALTELQYLYEKMPKEPEIAQQLYLLNRALDRQDAAQFFYDLKCELENNTRKSNGFVVDQLVETEVEAWR